jgi:[calcium/calmodulin-dependent protein kinase] kinase
MDISNNEFEEKVIERTYKDEDGFKHYDEYKVLRKYGEGSVGKVKEVMNTKTDQLYAMKIVNKLLLKMRKEYVRVGKGKMGIKTAFDAVVKEIKIIKELKHDNIVKLHKILTDEDGEKLFLILDNCDKGEIMHWDFETKTYQPSNGEEYFSEGEIRHILVNTITGLEYLHDVGVIHRDIKPHNLLITKDNKVKICDFGVACKVESREKDTLINTEGTYHFMPPECWNYDVKEFSGVKADIWALGVTLFAMTYNKMPFWADSELELSNVILKDEADFNQDRDVSLELKKLIQKLLIKDPAKRPHLAELIQNDPFFAKS